MPEFEECKNCGGYCCYVPREIETTYLDRVRIAKALDLTVGTQRLTTPREFEGKESRAFKFSMPCIFWIGGKCGIYDSRPDSCRNCEPRGNFNDCSEILLDSIKREIAPIIRVPYYGGELYCRG